MGKDPWVAFVFSLVNLRGLRVKGFQHGSAKGVHTKDTKGARRFTKENVMYKDPWALDSLGVFLSEPSWDLRGLRVKGFQYGSAKGFHT